MKQMLAIVISGFLGVTAQAQEAVPEPEVPVEVLEILPADSVVLEDFLWLKRVIVVFADTERNPAFTQQLELFDVRSFDLIERDVVILTDTNPAEPSDIRLKLRPRGFGLVLIDKDGGIKLRKPSPWTTREFVRSIDKFESRIEELQER